MAGSQTNEMEGGGGGRKKKEKKQTILKEMTYIQERVYPSW